MRRFFNFLSKGLSESDAEPIDELGRLKKSDLPLLCKLDKEELMKIIVDDAVSDDVINQRIWDPLIEEAAWLVYNTDQGSTSLIQRKLQISYVRAGTIIDQLESCRIISPYLGDRARDVLIKSGKKLEFILAQISLDRKYIEKFIQDNKQEFDALITINKRPDLTPENDRRERISKEVMDSVWNRDGGKCVQCGSQKNLEFDHIIPLSKGGANTYRNIQLLCEACNREKSNKVG